MPANYHRHGGSEILMHDIEVQLSHVIHKVLMGTLRSLSSSVLQHCEHNDKILRQQMWTRGMRAIRGWDSTHIQKHEMITLTQQYSEDEFRSDLLKPAV